MKKDEARKRIEVLKKEIEKYRYAYHVLDQSLISDEALDSLKKELFDLEQQYPEFITADSPTQRVGGEPLKFFKKVRHEVPMVSLNDAFSEKDMKDWYERIKKLVNPEQSRRIDFYCEHKFDGLAISLIYENGISGMRQAVSNTAKYGDVTRGRRIITTETRKEMKKILEEIQNGDFAREWILENQANRPVFKPF